MAQWHPRSDAVHWYMQEVSSRLVAKSGIPSDRHHLGKLIFQSFQDNPDFILQIDGGTGETETFGSALRRSVQCASAFKKLGLKQGDVIVLMAPNHIHLTIPMYAAFYLGVAVAGISAANSVYELRHTFSCNQPNMVFCQSERAKDVRSVIRDLNLETQVVTFDEGDESLSFSDLLKKGDDATVNNFKVADFDSAETLALLVATSGTTGLPKLAAVTHKNFAISVPYMWITFNKFPTPTRLSTTFSPIQWYSALFQFVFSPILKVTRLQSSTPITQDHAYYLINNYRPTFGVFSPNMLETFLKDDGSNKCDFSCFETIMIGGSFVRPGLIERIRKITPKTKFLVGFGISEISGIAFNYDGNLPSSLGKPLQNMEHRLVDPETLKDVTQPNVSGELWLRGPGIFKGYYNNPKATEQVLIQDGWFRTGDIMYRDENSNFYFVERLKLMLKYRSHQISPLEIENVIAKHPGVFEVAVTSIPDVEHGDLPVAFIVPRDNCEISAEKIKHLVKESLSDPNQLRGGVVFRKELPLTPSSKLDRKKLAAMAMSLVKS
ncbi:luciferin 4-monooxygenase-like [Melitaea cinxia]|uniref:luciferin 4-monooxygenase-like n=1 Tax=Melitaea cinxia TaxID=113334 RepID=UPI001E2718BF|nr:luciferin 4-monooxygenase-like [Melitaea cinxia]